MEKINTNPGKNGNNEHDKLHIFINKIKFDEKDGVKKTMMGGELADFVSVPRDNGSMVVSYTIGYLTSRFKMKANRIEFNLSNQGIQIAEVNEHCDQECRCYKNRGTADQDVMAIMSSSAKHWPKPEFL